MRKKERIKIMSKEKYDENEMLLCVQAPPEKRGTHFTSHTTPWDKFERRRIRLSRRQCKATRAFFTVQEAYAAL
jgi:hypothetical protein